MNSKAFMELEKSLAALWAEGRKTEAIALLEQSINKFPEKSVSMNLDLAFFYLGAEQVEDALAILKESAEKGIWYPRVYFRAYEEDVRFKEIFKAWDEISEIDTRNARPEWQVHTPEGYDSSRKYPLFVAMHGWGEDVDMFEGYWKSDRISKQYILVLPQSSQKVGALHYCWNDNDTAHRDLKVVYQHIVDNYSVDTDNIMVGGFSQGATTAIDLALNHNYMKVQGFIALNPDKPDAFNRQKIEEARDKGIRGYIITGDKDQSYEQQNEMMSMFETTGFCCEMDVIENWGHWFPEDLSQRMDKAIAYIRGE